MINSTKEAIGFYIEAIALTTLPMMNTGTCTPSSM